MIASTRNFHRHFENATQYARGNARKSRMSDVTVASLKLVVSASMFMGTSCSRLHNNPKNTQQTSAPTTLIDRPQIISLLKRAFRSTEAAAFAIHSAPSVESG